MNEMVYLIKESTESSLVHWTVETKLVNQMNLILQ